jgi:hypothetical protein
MAIAVAAAVAIMLVAAVLYVFVLPGGGGGKFNGALIVEAARAYSRDLRLRQQPVPKSVALKELVAQHYLKPEDVAAFRGMDATLLLTTDQPGPKAVVMRVRLADGTQVVLLTDGTVQELPPR